MSKKQEIARIQSDVCTPHLKEYYKSYINNIPTPSLSISLRKYATHQLITDQSENTNYTRMEHIMLSVITLVSKDLAIGIEHSYYTIIHNNQARDYIDRQVHGDGEIYFGSQKSCNNISIDFGRNTNDRICANPSRTCCIYEIRVCKA